MSSGERLLQIAARLQARAQPPLPPELVPLRIAGVRVGMAQPMVAHFLAQTEGFRLKNRELVMVDFGLDAEIAELEFDEARHRLEGFRRIPAHADRRIVEQ